MNDAPATSSQPLRERVLTGLEHLWCPLRVDEELRPYLEGSWHQPVAADALVAQNQDLQVLGAITTGEQHKQLD